MRYVKVSELEEMDVTQISGDDYILICDTSENKSKKLKVSNLAKYFKLKTSSTEKSYKTQ